MWESHIVINSPFPKLLTQSSCSVVKLTDRKIRWIIEEKSKDVLSTADIARLQNVSESRVRQLLCEYRKTGYIHNLKKPGRPFRLISYPEVSTVLSVFQQYPCNALTLESILLNRQGIKIPHNRIHNRYWRTIRLFQTTPTKEKKVDQVWKKT